MVAILLAMIAKSVNSDSQKPHERVRARLKEHGWSIAELARQMGRADEPAYLENLYKYLRGQVDNPRSDMVDEIARVTGLSTEFIRRGEQPNNSSSKKWNQEKPKPAIDLETFPPNVGYRPLGEFSFARVPLRGQTMGGKGGAIVFSTSDNMGDVLAPPQLFNVPDAYAVQVVGDSMLERFKDGWIVYVHPHRRVIKGDDCIIQIQNNDGPERLGWIKEFVSMDEKFLKVLQLNPRKIIKFPVRSVVSVHKIIMAGPTT
jgi:phage repressor protein C with HTH and peptisase S24 domain